MSARILIIVGGLLIFAFSSIAAQPEYFVRLKSGVVANYFNLSTGEMSSTSLPVKSYMFGVDVTLDAIAVATGSRWKPNSEIRYPEVSLINKEGDILRTFYSALTSSFLHHPIKKSYFFFNGYRQHTASVGHAINYYDYENDILQTVEFDSIKTNQFMAYNPIDEFIYFQGKKGSVYKIDTNEFKDVLISNTGYIFNDSGSGSVKYDNKTIWIYHGTEVVMTIPIYDLTKEHSHPREFYWINDNILFIRVGGFSYICDVNNGSYRKTEIVKHNHVFCNKTKTFYRIENIDGKPSLISISTASIIH